MIYREWGLKTFEGTALPGGLCLQSVQASAVGGQEPWLQRRQLYIRQTRDSERLVTKAQAQKRLDVTSFAL